MLHEALAVAERRDSTVEVALADAEENDRVPSAAMARLGARRTQHRLANDRICQAVVHRLFDAAVARGEERHSARWPPPLLTQFAARSSVAAFLEVRRRPL